MTSWMKKSLVVAAAAAMTVGMTAIAHADDVTLEFQQWWGVELPDGALQEIVDGFTEESGVAIELLSSDLTDPGSMTSQSRKRSPICPS